MKQPLENSSLCFPDGKKTCFACCPPIRPARYEHLQYEGIVKRMLRENTRAFTAGDDVRPITGFSCWGLGYLDPACTLVGCLLHPARHHGKDLRFRIDFGEKCRREVCPEAGIFDRLDDRAKAFWLTLTRGLDSFSYSSRKINPLFRLLNWGPNILGLAAREGDGCLSDSCFLFDVFPFFATSLSPRASAYPAERLLLRSGGEALLRDPGAAGHLEKLQEKLILKLAGCARPQLPAGAPHVNLLHVERSFRDFLRLALDIQRMDESAALELKARADEEVESYAGDLGFC